MKVLTCYYNQVVRWRFTEAWNW